VGVESVVAVDEVAGDGGQGWRLCAGRWPGRTGRRIREGDLGELDVLVGALFAVEVLAAQTGDHDEGVAEFAHVEDVCRSRARDFEEFVRGLFLRLPVRMSRASPANGCGCDSVRGVRWTWVVTVRRRGRVRAATRRLRRGRRQRDGVDAGVLALVAEKTGFDDELAGQPDWPGRMRRSSLTRPCGSRTARRAASLVGEGARSAGRRAVGRVLSRRKVTAWSDEAPGTCIPEAIAPRASDRSGRRRGRRSARRLPNRSQPRGAVVAAEGEGGERSMVDQRRLPLAASYAASWRPKETNARPLRSVTRMAERRGRVPRRIPAGRIVRPPAVVRREEEAIGPRLVREGEDRAGAACGPDLLEGWSGR